MNIWILSDLHHEMQTEIMPVLPEADVCILAGDISSPLSAAIEWAANEIGWKVPVIFVPGNHEFYRDSVAGGLERGIAAAKEHPGVHLLLDSSVVIDGVRFVGGSLWTDYALGAASEPGEGRDRDIAYAMRNAADMLNDHKVIRRLDIPDGSRLEWMPVDARQAHQRTRAYLESVLAEGFDGPTVVVTHHAPTPLSVHPRYKDSPLNPAFASDLSDMIWQFQPDLWVHGHVHDGFDYELGGTRVVCNPRGYGSENPDFLPALIVEVG